MSSYTDLRVWKRSFKLVIGVYKLTSSLPEEERFGLRSQIQRCAVSIPSNIAEGQQRNGRKEFRQFLGVARGSAGELSTQLLLVETLYKLETNHLVAELEEIQKMLYALQSKL
jgi:four helix bundle protein